ncbi:metallophosphoesterase family protein [Lysinibacillus parviboronicapiens]|uniref:metallophosphoesterase family protein n=1 Tax=Lysinibacillus parviboronicapiens TaxID=436516 RepID=UPI000D33DBB5|nr:metallophosphoesterase family protein [Lysinibacillus parviboronicapiens]
MLYALLGDLHSSIEDTKAVLTHIKQTANDAQIIGLGDLYECIVSKKRAKAVSDLPLQKAVIIEKDFENLLTFPSIRGNQEERITQVTGIKRFIELPETMEIDGATLMHGHQFKWSVTWQPTFPTIEKQLLFFGHSHESGLYRRNKKLPIRIHFGQPITLQEKQYGINVGSVVDHREWCLYDSEQRTVTFMCATFTSSQEESRLSMVLGNRN